MAPGKGANVTATGNTTAPGKDHDAKKDAKKDAKGDAKKDAKGIVK
jgi:hypothetical protein